MKAKTYHAIEESRYGVKSLWEFCSDAERAAWITRMDHGTLFTRRRVSRERFLRYRRNGAEVFRQEVPHVECS